MIAGFGGYLLPEEFVERTLALRPSHASAADLQRALKLWCASTRVLGPASGLRAIVDGAAIPLMALLGIDAAVPIEFKDNHACLRCRAGAHRMSLIVTAWGASLNRFWRLAVLEAAAAGASRCVLFNGIRLRAVRPGRMHSRRYVELELEAAADDAKCAAALALLFAAPGPDRSEALEDSLSQLIADGEHYAAGVCRSLRDGVLEASSHVLRALLAREGPSRVDAVFEQSLTIVYRLLFLFFAEGRSLVPVWHPIYRASYSVQALREAALDPASVGLWDGLRAVARLAYAGCQAGNLNVTAFNGRLFSPSRTPLAERRGLDDSAARRAIVAVSTRPAADGEGRDRISYRDLGVEQLGAVYETLLDYAPHVAPAARGRALDVSLRPGSGIRKSTGTFYTPQSLVSYLVRDTLAPLVRGATPERILDLKVLDPSMGSGAFLVGACRYLATAYERALVQWGRCHDTDIGASEQASIRRLVAERCLYGVDINPTAVQLARLSLWLATLASDRPLTFLDHHLRTGDSLAGTWLAQLRMTPGRSRVAKALPLFPEAPATEAIRGALPVRFSLALEPDDTVAQVRVKERALATLTSTDSPLAAWTRVADLWCATWLAAPPVPAAAFADLSDALLCGRSRLPTSIRRALLERVDAAKALRRLFHWELEFPEVFFDANAQRRADAGFDAILGNPPWDMVRADAGADRERARQDAASLVRFARDSGVFEVRSAGQVNRYQLFVERAMALAKPGGRIGLVLPSGVVADAGSASLRRQLFARCAVENVVGFDNRRGTFPIHRSVKFVLLSATTGRATREIVCRFGLTDPSALDRETTNPGPREPSSPPLRVTPSFLERVSGDDLSIPDMRSRHDPAVLERATELFAPLGSPDGWAARFGRELNATEDRASLRTDGRGLPVLEGKLIEPFRAAPERARWTIADDDAARLLGTRHRRSRLAYRDVASATNRVTLIAAILPPRTASTHTLFCLKTTLTLRAQWLLCALFNSLVVNFLVRMRVTIHVTTAIVERLPVPRVDQAGASADVLADAAATLARGHDSAVAARLNAEVARLYQLTDEEFVHVLNTFPLMDRTERDQMLHCFRRS